MNTSCKRLVAALALILPAAALVSTPVLASSTSGTGKTHHASNHKSGGHKSASHKKTTSTPS